jgi:hypothetical protein
LVAWAEAGAPVELMVRIGAVGRHELAPGVMAVTTPDGSTRTLKAESRDGLSVYTFKPRISGPIRFDWAGGSTLTLRPVRCNAPLALSTEGGLALFHSKPKLWFHVPNDRRRFAILVAGSGTTETVKATIHDASGKVVAEQDNIAAPHVFVPERVPSAQDEAWSVTLEPASEGVLEDVELRVLGISPLFVPSEKDRFVPR